MKDNLKGYLKLLIIPTTLFVIYLTMILLWKIFLFPSPEELVIIIQDYFDKYGLIVVFFSALIEGVLLLGQYFPGGFIIFLGVITAAGNILKASKVVLIVSLAFFIAYNINYFMGKYGWYKLFVKFGLKKPIDNSKIKLNKHGLKVILLSYWDTSIASITATAAGILNFPLLKFNFYSIIGILIWNTFWGVLVFKLGEEALKLTGLKYITVVFIIWITGIIIFEFIRRRKEKAKGPSQ